MDIAAISQKRYTAKVYDKSKKISESDFKQLCTLLRNCPSSVNSQPWHFIVASTEVAKDKILPAIAEFNHARVKDASHVVIFCAKTPLDDAHLNKILAQEEKDGRFVDETAKQGMDGGRRHFTGLNSDTLENQRKWEEKQIYIALGNLLLGAACIGIDSTPIEGFDTKKMDEILGLSSKGLYSVVVASLGYQSMEDFNINLPKSRLPEEEIFTFL